jgi:GT2 family glycosyltransferase
VSSIVLLAHNARPQLIEALDRLSHQAAEPRIIVVDNGSEDGSSDTVRDLYPKVTVVQFENELEWKVAERAGRAFAFGDDYAVVWLSEAHRMETDAPNLVEVGSGC